MAPRGAVPTTTSAALPSLGRIVLNAYTEVVVGFCLFAIAASAVAGALYAYRGKDTPKCAHFSSPGRRDTTLKRPTTNHQSTTAAAVVSDADPKSALIADKPAHGERRVELFSHRADGDRQSDSGPFPTSVAPVGTCRELGHAPDELDLSSLKTGDILAIGYRGIRRLFSKVVYDSVWTHASLVYIDPQTKEPFVIEANDYSPPYSGRVVRVPLLFWIRVNRKSPVIGHVAINKSAPSDALIASFHRFEVLDIGIESLKTTWTRFLGRRSPETVSEKSLFAADWRRAKPQPSRVTHLPFGRKYDYPIACHEIIISTLQGAGVVSGKFTPCSYLPSNVANANLPTINGYYYLPPKEVSVAGIAALARVW